MFNIGPMELLVLAIVGFIVVGPDKLPGLARDAARMLRTLRELANGAQTQLRDELGPEFADIDLRNLNPRTAITNAVFGDSKPSDLDPRETLRRVFADDEPAAAPNAGGPSSPHVADRVGNLDETKPGAPLDASSSAGGANLMKGNVPQATADRADRAHGVHFDADAT